MTEESKSPLQKLIEKWESEMGSYIPNAPIYRAFIEEAKAAQAQEVELHNWHFECWGKTGELQCIHIEALNAENATIIFKSKHPDLAFDPPY